MYNSSLAVEICAIDWFCHPIIACQQYLSKVGLMCNIEAANQMAAIAQRIQ